MRGKIEIPLRRADGKWQVAFTLTDDPRADYMRLASCEDLVIEAKPYRKRRSLNANAYFWVLCGKLAEKLNRNKDEVYLEMLEAYGTYGHEVIRVENLERKQRQYRKVRIIGEAVVKTERGESEGIQIQVYPGSSTYNTKEMSRLIDGTVQDAKELGIETLTPDEIDLMKSRWANAQEDKGSGNQQAS